MLFLIVQKIYVVSLKRKCQFSIFKYTFFFELCKIISIYVQMFEEKD